MAAGDVRKRCVEPVDGYPCGKRFRAPVARPREQRCPDHRPVPDGPIVAAVRAELESLDVLAMVEAALALRLALSLDDPKLAASSVSAMSGQLTKVLGGLRERAPRQPDRLDEIGQRLAAKTGARGRAR